VNSESVWDELHRFNDIIVKVEHVWREYDVDTEIVKAKLVFTDGTNLRVSESFIDGQLVSYSYYWLNESNQLIIGWDNAPHHRNVETFPHHKHVGTKTSVKSSKERCLKDVLSFIRRVLEE